MSPTLMNTCEIAGQALPTAADHALEHLHFVKSVFEISRTLMHVCHDRAMCEMTGQALPTAADDEMARLHITNSIF